MPMGFAVRGRLWILYVVAALAATAGYYALGQTVAIFHLIGGSAAVAILIGVAIYRPQHKLPWLLFALGQVFFVAGDVISYNYEKFFGTPLPYPAISDALYLAVYPCLIAGILLIVRRRSAGRDRGGLIDAAMIAIGIGVVSWVFLISPYVYDNTLLWQEKATAMAYPLMDLVLMAVTARLFAGGGRKPVSFYLLGTGVAALFVTDAIYGWLLLNNANGYTPGSGPLEAGWALFYILLGAAALHPSMRTVSDRQPEVDTTVSIARLAFLGGACLLAPATQAVAAGARTAGRSHRRLERHDRAVHPRGRPDGRAGAPTGAVGAARARAARGRVGARHGHGPRADLRGHAPGGADGGRRAVRRAVPDPRGRPAARRRGRRRPRRRRCDASPTPTSNRPSVLVWRRASRTTCRPSRRFIARSWGSPRRTAPC